MIQRMVNAALLRVETYEEVEADKSATLQALMVVILSAIAAGVGSVGTRGAATGFAWIAFGVAFGLVGWALWALITYFVGTTLFKTPDTHADWGELARTLGFAQSPGVLKVVGIVPAIGPLLFAAASIWQLMAMVVAIRQALDYSSTWRAVGVAVVGFIPYEILMALVFLVAAPL
ncbi:MAG: YIP1 family protein [Chloroflexi bacterium]|nr:YIP1 family protein [Chloroflexota bacterium]